MGRAQVGPAPLVQGVPDGRQVQVGLGGARPVQILQLAGRVLVHQADGAALLRKLVDGIPNTFQKEND